MIKKQLSFYHKAILIIVGISIGFFLCYIVIHHYLDEKIQEQAARAQKQRAIDTSKMKSIFQPSNGTSTTTTSSSNFSSSSAISNSISSDYSQKDANESLQWLTKTGRFPQEIISTYESYNEDALITMGQQGDLAALQELGSRFFSRDKNKSRQYYELAAIRGSIFAIQMLTIPGFSPNTTDGNSREAMISSLVFSELMKLRGDTFNGESQATSIKAAYKKKMGQEFAVDQMLIHEKANEIYKEWNDKRLAMNLREFDNTIPAGLQMVYNELR